MIQPPKNSKSENYVAFLSKVISYLYQGEIKMAIREIPIGLSDSFIAALELHQHTWP